MGVGYIIACLIFSASPGLGMLTITNAALYHSVRYCVFCMLGIQLANTFYISVVSLGLSTLLTQFESLFFFISTAGTLYLIWMGIQSFTASVEQAATEQRNATASHHALVKGLAVNLSNPKTIIFLAAFFPQFIQPEHTTWHDYLQMGTALVVIDVLVLGSFAVLATRVRPYLAQATHRQRLNKLFGVLFIAAASVLFIQNWLAH